VEEAEADACLEGARLVAKWTRQPTIIEADYSLLIDALRSEVDDRRPRAGVIKDIRGTCSLQLSEVKQTGWHIAWQSERPKGKSLWLNALIFQSVLGV
jgi:hypothetical protein